MKRSDHENETASVAPCATLLEGIRPWQAPLVAAFGLLLLLVGGIAGLLGPITRRLYRWTDRRAGR
jgi:hypothetical protein